MQHSDIAAYKETTPFMQQRDATQAPQVTPFVLITTPRL